MFFFSDTGKFVFSDFDSNCHKIIIFEEFDLKYYYTISMLKRLLKGRTFYASVKGGPPKYIKFNGPVIFVSNFRLADDVDRAFLNRLFIIEVDVPFWPYTSANPQLLAPKDESDAESVVSILSASSGHDTMC